MPYINKEDREEMIFGGRPPITAGELSFSLTQTVRRWVGPKPDYAILAAAVGVLFLTTLEFIRRVVFKYEDKKMEENGDVF